MQMGFTKEELELASKLGLFCPYETVACDCCTNLNCLANINIELKKQLENE